MLLADSIESTKTLVQQYIKKKSNEADKQENILLSPAAIDLDSTELVSIIDKIHILPKLDISESDTDVKTQADDFLSSANTLAKIFCLDMGLSLVADVYLNEIRLNLSNESLEKTDFQGTEIDKELLCAVEKLSLLFDTILHLYKAGGLPAVKNSFYSILQTVLETLLLVSTDAIGVFWNYMESRRDIMSSGFFDANSPLDRIALLKICNGLTDMYYERNSSGKYDSYEKNTFSDVFQARVRAFVTSIFNFDDATGLNKLLMLARRTNKEPHLGPSKTSDGHLLRDILSFQRLLRDPYTFLKNPRLLSSQVDAMSRLSAYFLDEEGRYAKIHPPRDLFAVKPETSASTQGDQKTDLIFSPEQCWLSAFAQTATSEELEAIKNQDEKYATKRFDQSKFRKLLLVQLFMVSCFFLELQASRKLTMLKTTDIPASAKHIIDETTPEHLAVKFQKMKRDILHQIRSCNTPLLFILQHLSHSEEYWWSWLIDGKQKGGSTLVSFDDFTEKDIAETQQKFDAAAPYKTKRYFNTYATPQLSRRMKVQTGLALLETSHAEPLDPSTEIEGLKSQIVNTEDENLRQHLIDQKDILVWKKIKDARSRDWLLLNSVLDPADLTDERVTLDDRKKDQADPADMDVDDEKKDPVDSADMDVDDEKATEPAQVEALQENKDSNDTITEQTTNELTPSEDLAPDSTAALSSESPLTTSPKIPSELVGLYGNDAREENTIDNDSTIPTPLESVNTEVLAANEDDPVHALSAEHGPETTQTPAKRAAPEEPADGEENPKRQATSPK